MPSLYRKGLVLLQYWMHACSNFSLDTCMIDHLWQEWENPTSSAAWCKLGPGAPPFKAGCIMTKIPGCQTPESVLLDYCHIFHLGYGCDIGASSIVLLSRLGHFGQGSFDVKLACAYERFDEWCRANSHTSHISIFSRLAFDMSSLLARTLHAFNWMLSESWGYTDVWKTKFTVRSKYGSSWISTKDHGLANQHW